MHSIQRPEPFLPRQGSHEREWLDAIRGKVEKPTSNFDYAGRLIETLMLGNVATLLGLDLGKTEDPGLHTDGDYAISWIRTFGKGRVFYCALGHAKTAYTNPAVMKHDLAGIQFATGELSADATPRP